MSQCPCPTGPAGCFLALFRACNNSDLRQASSHKLPLSSSMSKFSSSLSWGLFEDVVESGEGDKETTLREREGCRPCLVCSTTNLLPLSYLCEEGPGLPDECEAAGVALWARGSTLELTAGRPQSPMAAVVSGLE